MFWAPFYSLTLHPFNLSQVNYFLTLRFPLVMLETIKTIIVSKIAVDEKEKILDYTEEKFFKDGFYKTSMDLLAAEMRMSKKTIYKFFPSKEELVKAITNRFKNRMKGIIVPLLNSDKNAVEKLIGLITILSKTTTKISMRLLDDMQKHFPLIWKEIDKFRTEMMFNNITRVIDQGKKEGLIANYPTPIIMNIFVSSIRATVNPEFVVHNNFSLTVSAQTTFKIILRGILTEKGKKFLIKSFNEIEI